MYLEEKRKNVKQYEGKKLIIYLHQMNQNLNINIQSIDMVGEFVNTETIRCEFIPYQHTLELKSFGFDINCFGYYSTNLLTNEVKLFIDNRKGFSSFEKTTPAPTFSQAINFLYICSNKQIDIELKASDTYKERLRKIDQGCEDLWNLQNSKSN
jgi:hypothetical protein